MPVGALSRTRGLFLREDEELDQYTDPAHAERRATDLPFCFAFVIVIQMLGAVLVYSFAYGDPMRLAGLPDSKGQVCGVSRAVEHLPYLYFCQNNYHLLARSDRICVQKCHASPSAGLTYRCPGEEQSAVYPSVPFAGVVCMPPPEQLGLSEGLYQVFLGDQDVTAFLSFMGLWRAWPAIFLSTACAAAAAFVYLLLIRRCNRATVPVGLLGIVLGVAVLSAYLLRLSQVNGADGIPRTGDGKVALLFGIVTLCFCVVVLLIIWAWRRNIQMSIACIKAACECIWDMPSILFQPFVALAMTLPALALLVSGFIHLVSCISYYESPFQKQSFDDVHVDYTVGEHLLMIFYVLVSIWVIEFITALSYFVVAYSTQLWFFADYHIEDKSKESPGLRFASCTGYRVGLCNHLGTIAAGSLFLSILRIPRMILGTLHYFITEDDMGNSLVRCISTCFQCCLDAIYHRWLKYFTTYAYFDVAINGSRFLKAAYVSLTLMEQPAVHFMTRHGAAWLIQFTGLCATSGMGALMTFFICKFSYVLSDQASEDHVHSQAYVPTPSLMAALAFAVCWAVSAPFLLLCGHVSDCILFCFAIEKQRYGSRNVIMQVEESMVSRLMSCTSREVDKHTAASTYHHPPETQRLLEAGRQENGCTIS